MSDERTPGQLDVDCPYGEPGVWLAAQDTSLVAKVHDQDGKARDNARFLAACWNAADEAGLTEEALRAGVVVKMVAALERIVSLAHEDPFALIGQIVEHGIPEIRQALALAKPEKG